MLQMILSEKTVAGFLFPIHVQNVIADNYIILRMEKKVVYFFSGI